MSPLVTTTKRGFTPDLQDVLDQAPTKPWASRFKEMEREVADARTYLMMRHNFFGRLVMKMKCIFTDQVPTAAIRADAVCMINPEFWGDLDLAERSFLLAHECCHLAYMFFERLGLKNVKLFNIAQDHMINLMLEDAGLKLIRRDSYKGEKFEPCADPRFKEMSDEAIYSVLWEEMKQKLQQGNTCQSCGQSQSQQQQGGGQGQQQQQGGGQGQQQGQGNGGGQHQHGQGQPQGGQGGGQREQDDQQQGQDQQDGQGGGDGQEEQDQPQQGQGQGGCCPECGQQKPQHGYGMEGGDCDASQTERLKQEQGEGRSGDRVMTAGQWRAILTQAASATIASGRGDVPGAMKRWIEEINDPKVDWATYFRRIVSEILRQGHSYRRPGRHTGALNAAARNAPWARRGVGLTTPGPRTSPPKVFVTIDVSGSVGPDELKRIFSEVKGVIDACKAEIVVLVWDTHVRWHGKVRDYEEIELIGGGGTDVREVHRFIMEDEGGYGMPKLVVHLTDMCTPFPSEEDRGPFPTLWGYITTNWMNEDFDHFKPEFGEVIAIPKGEQVDLRQDTASRLLAAAEPAEDAPAPEAAGPVGPPPAARPKTR